MDLENPHIVYIKTDSNGYITDVNSFAFLQETTGWIEIDEGYGDRYHHAQGNYFDKPIITESGAYQYKLENGKSRECTAEEIEEQEAAINKPPVPVAPRNVITGECVTINGTLYKAIKNIPAGEPVIIGQNAVETTYEAELLALSQQKG